VCENHKSIQKTDNTQPEHLPRKKAIHIYIIYQITRNSAKEHYNMPFSLQRNYPSTKIKGGKGEKEKKKKYLI